MMLFRVSLLVNSQVQKLYKILGGVYAQFWCVLFEGVVDGWQSEPHFDFAFQENAPSTRLG